MLKPVERTMSPERDAYPSLAGAITTLGLLMLAYVISLIDRQVLALMVNPIKADLHISDFQMSLLQGFAFALFFCILGIPCGRLADRYNRRLIIVGGIALWSLMTIACGLAGNYTMLFIARMGVGVGEAALAPAAYSLIMDSFRKERVVWAMSIFTLSGQLGGALALLLGGVVIDYISHQTHAPFGLSQLKPWQLTFILVGLPGFAVAAVLTLLDEPTRKGGAGEAPPFGQALALLWARRGDYIHLYGANALLSVLYGGGVAWAPTHLIRSFGLSAGEVGLLLGLIYLIAPLAGVTMGAQLTTVFAARGYTDAPLRSVMITAAVAGVLYLAPLLPSLQAFAVVWFLMVVFQSGYYGNLMTALQTITPNRLRATNVAIMTIATNLGGFGIGISLIAAVSDGFFAGDPHGIGQALAIVGSLCGLGTSLVAARGLEPLRKAMALFAQA